ncbi:MAG: Hpt domain-containing protein, partial [Thiohalobacterales bacterium]|nr:Hpt domain-containing protein [Thiohalobacterales bacterium]
LDAVIREVVSAMATAKEHINDYLKRPEDDGSLHEVPVLLNQVSGGLKLAGQEELAGLVDGIDGYNANELIGGKGVPGNDVLDTLADAICSVEFYDEELKEDRLYGDMVLDVARRSVAKLGYAPGVESVPDTSLAAEADMDAPFGELAGDVAEVASEPEPEAEMQTSLVSGLQVIADDADEEILEIFIEEAGEEIGALQTLIPQWQSDTTDMETLQIIRRHLHTLKGSGRMVGAMSLGEFAWVLENLLNRIIDGSLAAGADIADLLTEARIPLMEMLAQISEGSTVATDVDLMAARAMALADGAEAEHAAAAAVTPATDVVSAPAVPADFSAVNLDEFPVLEDGADPEIVEIYLEEAAEAIATIENLVPQWRDSREDDATLETVRRAFHTLKGSGRMAGAMRIGEFAWVLENLLNRVVDGSVAPGEELACLLDGVSQPLGELLQQLADGTEPTSDAGQWVLAAGQLLRGEPAGLSFGAGDEPELQAQPVADAAELPVEMVDV